MKKKSILWMVALVVITVAALYVYTNGEGTDVMTEPTTEDTVPVKQAVVKPKNEQQQNVAALSEDTQGSESYAEEEPAAGDNTTTEYTRETDQNLMDTVLSDRTLGNPEAPVTVREFASLTCGHCAKFYTETFPELREKYIETGKVYFIYEDFPLNAPALEATLVARCLPEDKFFNFIKFLYSTQQDWAYEANYSSYLKQNAKLLGLSEDRYEACLNNNKLQDAFSSELSESQKKYELRSTPTFIITETGSATVAGKIVGSQPVQAFESQIDPLLNKAEQK